MTDVIGL